MAATANLILSGFETILGSLFEGGAQIQAGNAQYRIAVVNAENILKTSQANALLIEQGTEANAANIEFNARMAEAKGRDAVYRAKEDEAKLRLGVKGLIGSQRASFAAQGIDVNLGSSVDVQASTAYQGELDAQTIRVNGGREAWGFQQEAFGDWQQAAAVRKVGATQAQSIREKGQRDAQSQLMQGQYVQTARKSIGVSTILTTAGKVALSLADSKRGKG